MRKKRRRFSGNDTIDQINVTPLLDLTFLLLIVFMISMPLMEYGTAIQPPSMDSNDLPTENLRSITITKTGTLMLGNDAVTREELLHELTKLHEHNPKCEILLRADGVRTYKEVIELMADIRKTGYTDVTLVTQAED